MYKHKNKQDETKEKQNYEMLEAMIKNFPGGISVIDDDLRLAWSNHLFYKNLDLPEEIFPVGSSYSEIIRFNAKRGDYGVGDVEEMVRERVELALNPTEHCFERQRPDGTVLEIRGYPLPNGGFVTTYSDITKRVKIRHLHQNQKEELFQILMNVPRAIITTDNKGNILTFNRHAEKIFGYTFSEAVKQNISILIPLSTRKHHDEYIKLYQDTGKKRFIDQGPRSLFGLHKDGSEFPLELSLAQIGEGANVRYLGVARDNTDVKLREKEDKKRDQLIFESQKLDSIGQLAGGVAHEINNMLVPVLGMISLAMEDLPDKDPSLEKLKIAMEGADQAKKLVTQILQFSRNKIDNELNVLIGDAVSEAVNLLRASLPATIKINYHSDAHDVQVKCSSDKIFQIIMNFGMNSKSAFKNQHGNLDIGVDVVDTTKSDGVYEHATGSTCFARLTFSDDGCGIDKSITKRIFDPFFTTKEVGEGTGLGLSVIHGIVNSCGGSIAVESEPGKGTTFVVSLPLAGEDFELNALQSVIA